MSLRNRINTACPVLRDILLGDFIKSVKDILTGETTGLLSSVTLAPGTTASTSLKVGANVCAFAGENKKKAESEVALTTTDHDVAESKYAGFRVSINSSGTISISKGDDQDSEALALENIPAVPEGEADLGYFVVSGSFTAGTDDLAGDFYPADSVLAKYAEIDD